MDSENGFIVKAIKVEIYDHDLGIFTSDSEPLMFRYQSFHYGHICAQQQ